MRSASREMPHPDGAPGAWLAFIIRGKLDVLVALLGDTNTPLTIERVHKLRVNARRLEAILNIFEERFQRKKARQLRRELRSMIGVLGKVREYDVLLGMLERRAAALSARERFVVNFLLVKVSRRQQKVARRLRGHLATVRPREFRRRTRQAIATMADAGVRSGAAGDAGMTFRETMREIIPRLYGEFMSYEERVRDRPDRLKEFHKMRLAGKPLRYMMEIVLPVAGPAAKKRLRDIVVFLTEMGAIHDHDVAIGAIADFLDDITSYDPAMKKGVAVLDRMLEKERGRREALFRKLCATMHRWDRENFRSALIQSIA